MRDFDPTASEYISSGYIQHSRPGGRLHDPVTAAIGVGGSLLGGALAGRSAKKAAQIGADAQTQAAQMAAEEARFRPVAITTGFGKSNFEMDEEGRLKAAGYELTPEMQALRDALIAQTAGGLGLSGMGQEAAQGLFGLGQQYLAQTPEEASAQWMQAQQAALTPSREAALSNIRKNLFNTGRTGLSVAQGGDLSAANPELQAYYNALAQQDLNLAAQAQEQGRAQTQFGQGLLSGAYGIASGAYQPLQTQIGTAGSIEELGQKALGLGSELGGRASTAGGTAAEALLRGGLSAAQTMQQANAYNPLATAITGLSQNQGLMSSLGGLFSGSQPSMYSLGTPGAGTGLGLQAPSSWSSPWATPSATSSSSLYSLM